MYAGIESIGGMVGVSSPPEESEGPVVDRTEDQEQEMFERIKMMLGAEETPWA